MAKTEKRLPLVGLIMGSQSDWATMKHAADTLEALGVPFEARIVSAHRTPARMAAYAGSARKRGLKVIIAGAGGAAHLPGMTAAMTDLPVLGVPVESAALKGMDSLLSIVQMPAGVPVGTLAIGRSGASVELVVTDDGQGFDVAGMRSGSSGLGLVSMEERARVVGGAVTVVSGRGRGTTVRVVCPTGTAVADVS